VFVMRATLHWITPRAEKRPDRRSWRSRSLQASTSGADGGAVHRQT
jgi:hypothetical protein